mmetsp:Transcript_26497/g.34510  ORF Transcript_26497/g.34510 Transcript_26497/m.34510 type:complete len:283 (-) Transcript_26497:392-1240(-)
MKLTAATGVLWYIAFQCNEVVVNSFSPQTILSPSWGNSMRSATTLRESADDDNAADTPARSAPPPVKIDPAILLQPFLPAVDPMFKVRGPVGEEDFIISRTGGPTDAELTNENILKIVLSESSDLEANTLCWKCLGYRFDEENERWTTEEVFPKWRDQYPEPPDFIGMQRIYSKEVDQPSLTSNRALTSSIPVEHKQMLKVQLKPLGFKGFQFSELTPNKTRRAQVANWILFFREELMGYTVEELRERRRLKREAEEAEKQRLREQGENLDDEWQYPLKEVL